MAISADGVLMKAFSVIVILPPFITRVGTIDGNIEWYDYTVEHISEDEYNYRLNGQTVKSDIEASFSGQKVVMVF